MDQREHEIEVAITAWIREINATEDVSLEYIQTSFADLQEEFDIPEERALLAVTQILGED